MYPTLYDAVKDLFGLSIPFLKLLQSFGFFVAISFLLCAWVFAKELKRKDEGGLFPKFKETFRKIMNGAKMSQADLITQFVFAFLLGWKIIPIFFDKAATIDPRSYVLSMNGNLISGILVGAIWTGIVWYWSKKKELPEPKETKERIGPAEHVGNMTMIAALFGFLGAKLFHILENFGSFIKHPGDMLLSFSGFTMYGGLILGGISVLVYAHRQGMNIFHVMDACAPGLFLAYGVGRLGCHVSGDGDWGIVNTAAKPNWMGFLPDWIWAYDYPNNVNEMYNPYIEGSPEYLITNLTTNFENSPHLVAPVYPTPFYEAAINVLFFVLIWSLRKRFFTPGLLFSTYLCFNGLERFFIEIIRVNNVMFQIGSFPITQAQIIASGLVFLGLIGIVYTRRRKVIELPSPNA
jgi:phosphatidylglycerol---prolipoprotein diacylglyceryl transferase